MNPPVPVMVNGLPGNVSATIATHFIQDSRFTLIPFSLTGPEIEEDTMQLCGMAIRLVKPEVRATVMDEIKQKTPDFITSGLYPPHRRQCQCRILCLSAPSICHGNHRRRSGKT